MDPEINVPYGPHRIQKISTVTVPRALLSEVGLEPGSSVHWALNPDIPGTLILIPSRQLERVMEGLIESLRGAG